jgi:hypothetical protein
MDHICLTIPVLSRQGDVARAFMAELESYGPERRPRAE